MFLHELSKCSVHQYENTDSAEAEARTDAELQTAVAVEATANSPLVVVTPPQKFPHVPCSQQKGSVHAPSSTSSKINHISLKEQNELELWLNLVSVGWGRRCRSTPSTARRFQAVRATTADVASRFTCMLQSDIWGFLSKSSTWQRRPVQKMVCLRNYNHLDLFFGVKKGQV